MNFPNDEEIDNLETGDIVIIPLTEEGFLSGRNSILEGEKYLLSRWFFLGKNSDNDLICLFVSSETSNINLNINHPVYDWLEDEDKLKFTKIINKIPIKDLENIDINKSRYFSKKRVIKIEKKMINRSDPVGMNCCECNEYYHYAVPNLSNGNLACWSCRDSYKWKYSELYIGGK